MMFGKIFGGFFSGNMLYYPGCLTHFALPEIEGNYKRILRELGVDFIFVPDFFCCGSPVKHAGYAEDFESLVVKNKSFMKKYGVGKIITNCPACYRVLSDAEFKVEHVTQTIAARLKKVSARHSGEITYHDPCHLGRHGGIYEEPRKILAHIGFEVVELPKCREDSLCCGGGGGFRTNYPDVSGEIAKFVLSKVKTKKLVTTCPMCYRQFKDNAKGGVEVYELSELLV
jgi:Fe-S oxidoreductase